MPKQDPTDNAPETPVYDNAKALRTRANAEPHNVQWQMAALTAEHTEAIREQTAAFNKLADALARRAS